MEQEFDLLGDPIPEGFGKRGRPPHRVTDEKRRLVIQLCAFGWSIERIAAALSITPPTLRKNYLRELKVKEEARARVEGKLLSALMKEVEAGNVTAIDKYFKRLDKLDQAVLADRIRNAGLEPKAPKPEKLGKKEKRQRAADNVAGKFAVPSGPKRLVN